MVWYKPISWFRKYECEGGTAQKFQREQLRSKLKTVVDAKRRGLDFATRAEAFDLGSRIRDWRLKNLPFMKKGI